MSEMRRLVLILDECLESLRTLGQTIEDSVAEQHQNHDEMESLLSLVQAATRSLEQCASDVAKNRSLRKLQAAIGDAEADGPAGLAPQSVKRTLEGTSEA